MNRTAKVNEFLRAKVNFTMDSPLLLNPYIF